MKKEKKRKEKKKEKKTFLMLHRPFHTRMKDFEIFSNILKGSYQ